MDGLLFHAYAAMLPRLQAEESLRRVTEYAIGSGAADKHERQRVMRAWERHAEGPRPTMTPEQLTQQAQAMGIPVRRQVRNG